MRQFIFFYKNLKDNNKFKKNKNSTKITRDIYKHNTNVNLIKKTKLNILKKIEKSN